MTFLIADTFTAALDRLTAPEKAAAKQAAFDLQVDPSAPGLSLHRVDRSRDRDFWTARVTRDLRIVLHKRAGDTLLAFVGHHDDAYAWAERRRPETHPATGAAQLVEVRERVEEIAVPVAVPVVPAAKPALFARTPEATLLLCGVPADWLGPVRIATTLDVTAALATAALAIAADGVPVDPAFLRDEWRLIVDARDVRDAATYRGLPRHGRRVRLTGDRRDTLWTVFARARAALADRGLKTYAEALHDTAAALTAEARPPFDHVLVDEAQDLTLAELRFLRAAVSREINGLFFAGDIGQRIFRPPFAWSAEGVEIRGRSRSLKVNYRTSRQIRRRADLLLPPRLVELEGAEEDRTGVQSLFDGPLPEIRAFPTEEAEAAFAAAWLAQAVADGIRPEEIAVLVRSIAEFPRAERAIADAGLDASPLVARAIPGTGRVVLATMHTAKGLEFRAVAVLACDADILPSASRLAEAADETALTETFATERHLLYVAGTRARERLLVSGRSPASAFLRDLLDA